VDAFHERLARVGLSAAEPYGFDRRIFADALQQADRLDADDFADYGTSGQALQELRSRSAQWRTAILSDDR
jgi:hypothetical protein